MTLKVVKHKKLANQSIRKQNIPKHKTTLKISNAKRNRMRRKYILSIKKNMRGGAFENPSAYAAADLPNVATQNINFTGFYDDTTYLKNFDQRFLSFFAPISYNKSMLLTTTSDKSKKLKCILYKQEGDPDALGFKYKTIYLCNKEGTNKIYYIYYRDDNQSTVYDGTFYELTAEVNNGSSLYSLVGVPTQAIGRFMFGTDAGIKQVEDRRPRDRAELLQIHEYVAIMKGYNGNGNGNGNGEVNTTKIKDKKTQDIRLSEVYSAGYINYDIAQIIHFIKHRGIEYLADATLDSVTADDAANGTPIKHSCDKMLDGFNYMGTNIFGSLRTCPNITSTYKNTCNVTAEAAKVAGALIAIINGYCKHYGITAADAADAITNAAAVAAATAAGNSLNLEQIMEKIFESGIIGNNDTKKHLYTFFMHPVVITELSTLILAVVDKKADELTEYVANNMYSKLFNIINESAKTTRQRKFPAAATSTKYTLDTFKVDNTDHDKLKKDVALTLENVNAKITEILGGGSPSHKKNLQELLEYNGFNMADNEQKANVFVNTVMKGEIEDEITAARKAAGEAETAFAAVNQVIAGIQKARTYAENAAKDADILAKEATRLMQGMPAASDAKTAAENAKTAAENAKTAADDKVETINKLLVTYGAEAKHNTISGLITTAGKAITALQYSNLFISGETKETAKAAKTAAEAAKQAADEAKTAADDALKTAEDAAGKARDATEEAKKARDAAEAAAEKAKDDAAKAAADVAKKAAEAAAKDAIAKFNGAKITQQQKTYYKNAADAYKLAYQTYKKELTAADDDNKCKAAKAKYDTGKVAYTNAIKTIIDSIYNVLNAFKEFDKSVHEYDTFKGESTKYQAAISALNAVYNKKIQNIVISGYNGTMVAKKDVIDAIDAETVKIDAAITAVDALPTK